MDDSQTMKLLASMLIGTLVLVVVLTGLAMMIA